MFEMVAKLGSLANDRIILSYSPKTLCYQALKQVGELFPGRSKVTRAYLHSEQDVRKALDNAGFEVRRVGKTATKFYFSNLIEAVRKTKPGSQSVYSS
jgi:magnesium-protoporphyrin O-methyltransferase